MSSNSAVEEQTLIYRLLHFSKNTSEQQAFVTPKYSITYSQLYELVSKQACLLAELGIDENAIVGIKCPEESKHLILCLACSYIGATSFTIPSYEPKELQQSIKTRCNSTHELDATHAISVNEVHIEKGKYESQGMQIDSRFLFSSSGTTGEAKLVIHNSSDLVAQAHRHINSSSERFLCLASIEHNFAKRHRLYCLAQGATNIFLNLEEENFIKACKNLEVNVLHVSVFQAQQLLAVPKISELSDIRLKLGGSHAPNSLRQQLKQNITSNLQAGYGTTETGAICFTEVHDQYAGESVGKTLPGIEIRTVSTERKTLPFGEKGELAIRCKGMFRGYLNKPDLTAKTLEDDWFYTGDIGYLDAQQRVHLSGRADDMFVFNSINIYPQDIESSLRQFVSVKDVAVIPKESEVHGNIPIALIVFNSKIEKDTELQNFKSFAYSELGLRCPQQFIIVEKIPRNTSGKISRLQAKKIAIKNENIKEKIIESLRKTNALKVKSEIIEKFKKSDSDVLLEEVDLDSIIQMELLVMIETLFDTVITPKVFSEFSSLNDIVSFVLNSKGSASLKKAIVMKQEDGFFKNDEVPYVVRLFKRVFCFCNTVAQLNKALKSFEYRLTPLEVYIFHEWNSRKKLLPNNIEEKFYLAFDRWMESLIDMIQESGKQVAEPFTKKRLKPMITHFVGVGKSSDKVLLICFSIARSRDMGIPNAVFLQHVNAQSYDLLVIAAPSAEGFYNGLPLIGKNEQDIVSHISNLELVSNYKSIRTIGNSAGAPIAMMLAKRLSADVAISLGGRFHKYKYPIKIIRRFYAMLTGIPDREITKVIFCYSVRRRRDRHFAKLMKFLFGGSLLALKVEGRKFSHTILEDLLELHKLKFFLEQTVLIQVSETMNTENLILSFPKGDIELMK